MEALKKLIANEPVLFRTIIAGVVTVVLNLVIFLGVKDIPKDVAPAIVTTIISVAFLWAGVSSRAKVSPVDK